MIVNYQRLLQNRGFTLLEVVVVLVIIGILSITVIPSWTATSQRVEYEARRVLSDIRYTQAMSIASGERYRFVLTSSTSYQITNSAGTAVILPSGSTTMTLASGISFGSLTNLPSSLIVFDTRGVPYTTTGSPGTALGSTAVIPLLSGASSRNITILPVTGFGALS